MSRPPPRADHSVVSLRTFKTSSSATVCSRSLLDFKMVSKIKAKKVFLLVMMIIFCFIGMVCLLGYAFCDPVDDSDTDGSDNGTSLTNTPAPDTSAPIKTGLVHKETNATVFCIGLDTVCCFENETGKYVGNGSDLIVPDGSASNIIQVAGKENATELAVIGNNQTANGTGLQDEQPSVFHLVYQHIVKHSEVYAKGAALVGATLLAVIMTVCIAILIGKFLIYFEPEFSMVPEIYTLSNLI